MTVVREKIKQNRILHLPQEIWRHLGLKPDVEVDLQVEEGQLIVTPVWERKRLRLAPDLVDELVANEEFYLPEGA